MKRRSHELIALPVLVLALSAGACSDPVDPDQALEEGLAQQQAGNLEAAAEQYQRSSTRVPTTSTRTTTWA